MIGCRELRVSPSWLAFQVLGVWADGHVGVQLSEAIERVESNGGHQFLVDDLFVTTDGYVEMTETSSRREAL